MTAGDPSKPPLLLFHGVGDNSALMWIFNAKALSKDFYVIAVDTLGGPGKSEPNLSYTTGFDQARWINELLERLNLDKVNLAGVSNGSYLASTYTVTYPDNVHRMVGMAGGVKLNMLRMAMLFLPEALFPASETTTRKLLRKLCAPGTSNVFENNEEIMKHWTYLLQYFNNRSMMAHTYRKFTEQELRILQQKALFLVGEHDRLSHYPAAIKALAQHQIPYKIIASAGHGINHEQAERINEEIRTFLLESYT